MHKLAIFASGNGTNAQRIIEYFAGHAKISVELVLSNNPDAYVLIRAANMDIAFTSFTRQEFYHSISGLLKQRGITHLILAGFMWLIPANLLTAYPGHIFNIHPALLPKFGGKGMYGHHVHEAVIAAGETESGITIHYVNAQYDEGEILFQAKCVVIAGDTPDALAARIHELEHRHYPEVIEKTVMKVIG